MKMNLSLKEIDVNKELMDPGWVERILQAIEVRPFATLALLAFVVAVGFCIWAYRRNP